MKKIFLSLLILLSINYSSFGCSCNFSGPFMKVSKQTDLTVVAKINSKGSGKINVEIEKILIGKSEKKTITINGDKDGASCYEVLGNYLVGETYAFALSLRNGKYYLSACGEYSLKIENGSVKGMVDDSFMDKTNYWPKWNQKTMSEPDFYALFVIEGKVYTAPCRSVIKYENSEDLAEKLEKSRNELASGKTFDFMDFNAAVKDNNLPLVEFYIENTNLLKEENLADLVLLAVEKGYIDLVNLFLDKGVSANTCSSSSFYLVYRAVLHPEILMELHKRGADLHPRGYGGTTTIMHAVREGCIESIAYLIDNGADLKEKSKNGKKASDYADFNKRNKAEVKKYLKNR